MLVTNPSPTSDTLTVPAHSLPADAACIGCGYSLQGLNTTRCPECGRNFDPADPTTYKVTEINTSGVPLWLQSTLIICALYVACLATLGPSLRLSQWFISPENNQCAAEAVAWLEGHKDFPIRGGDVALYNGHFYNVFPPLMTFICYIFYGLHLLLLGPPPVFFTAFYVLFVAVPVPLLIYLAMRRSGLSLPWAAVFAFYAIAGTCLRTEASLCQRGWIYSVQHVLSQTGIAILLIDLLGKRRFWLAGIGVLLASWSRQTCIAYALQVLWLALRSPNPRIALTKAGIPIFIALAVPMTMNWIKFDSPFETGYRYIFADIQGGLADYVRGPNGEVQVFALRYMPNHLYEMWISPPNFDLKYDGLDISGAGEGSAIWYGTPMLLFPFFYVRRWWPDKTRRALMLSTLPIIVAILAYHGPGFGAPGYYRYSIDFALVWLAVIAPWTIGPRRSWLTFACVIWSIFYFYMLTPYIGL